MKEPPNPAGEQGLWRGKGDRVVPQASQTASPQIPPLSQALLLSHPEVRFPAWVWAGLSSGVRVGVEVLAFQSGVLFHSGWTVLVTLSQEDSSLGLGSSSVKEGLECGSQRT